jgi:MFS superfamily sulfate permease-like transporter
VAVSAGAKSQAAGLIAAGILAALLLAAPGLTTYIPSSALAAVVILAAYSLTDFKGLVRLYGWRKTEFGLAVISFLGVIFLGVLPGVFVAIALSVMNFVRRQWRPHDAVLGRAPGVKGYHDINDFTDAVQVPGLLIYRFDAPLFFANAEAFRDRVGELVDGAPVPVKRVVIAAEPITDVDTSAVDSLCGLVSDMDKRGVELTFAELKHPVRARLERYGVLDSVGADALYPTLGSAVHAYVRDFGVDWVDWQDEAGESDETATD